MPKRGAVLLLDDAKAWAPEDFGDMFSRHLSGSIEWVKLKVAAGEDIIVNETVSNYDCFVLTGSRFNVRDRDSLVWFEPVAALIRAVELDSSKRLYGGCFGCQIAAFALGGVVDKNPSERFCLLAETLVFEPPGADDASSSSRGIVIPPSLTSALPALRDSEVKVIVSHGDCVRELPPAASVRLAHSASCANEVYLAGRHSNILCMQSHPEFDYEYAVQERIWPAVVEKNKRLREDEVAVSRASFEAFGGRAHGPDRLMSLIRNFLEA